MAETVLRLCEWASVDTRGTLTADQRASLAEAADAWKEAHRLPSPPFAFSGPQGETLTARQYVGVVEVGDICLEIYPKLDAALLDRELLPGEQRGDILSQLLWLMEAAREASPFATDTAPLAEAPLEFAEVFALLLARNLRAELGRGPVRRYLSWEDDLKTVRGRVSLREQVTRNWDRLDRVACAWDEFTPDIALNRVLRCACRILRTRVSGPETRRLLTDCLELLDDVEDIPIPAALAAARSLRHFDRTMERFRLPYDLAVRLLASTGHALQTASTETFVFLVDMNALFEQYVHAALEAAFRVRVRTQEPVWKLLPHLPAGYIAQKPDFYLTDLQNQVWIGDAKYKHLAKGQNRPLTFAALANDPDTTAAGRLLSPEDIRQLTVYAELDRRKRHAPEPARLLLLYPYVGTGTPHAAQTTAWNSSRLALVPVRLTRTENLARNLTLPTAEATREDC